MDDLLKSLFDSISDGPMPPELAEALLASREFESFNSVGGDHAATRAKIVSTIMAIPDEELDTLFVGMLVKGKVKFCEDCDRDHTGVDLMVMGIGDNLTMQAMLSTACYRIAKGDGSNEHKTHAEFAGKVDEHLKPN